MFPSFLAQVAGSSVSFFLAYVEEARLALAALFYPPSIRRSFRHTSTFSFRQGLSFSFGSFVRTITILLLSLNFFDRSRRVIFGFPSLVSSEWPPAFVRWLSFLTHPLPDRCTISPLSQENLKCVHTPLPYEQAVPIPESFPEPPSHAAGPTDVFN